MVGNITLSEKTYNEAVYLNNAGCSLIEHGAYHEALDTVRDAILVMKASSGDSNSVSVTESRIDLDSMITRAAQRMAHLPMTARSKAKLGRFDERVQVSTFALSELSQLEIDDMMTINLDEEMLVCPIRIEADEFCRHAPPSDDQRDLDSAIMLHNLGVVNACLAKHFHLDGEETDASLRDQLQEAAIQIFRFADQTLAPYSANLHHPDGTQVSKIHMAILHSLLQVRLQQQLQRAPGDVHVDMRDSEELLLDQDCEDVLDRLYMLQDFIFMSEQFAPFQRAELLPAPAA